MYITHRRRGRCDALVDVWGVTLFVTRLCVCCEVEQETQDEELE